MVLTQSLCFFLEVISSEISSQAMVSFNAEYLMQNIFQKFSCCLCTVTKNHVCAQEHICVLWEGRSYLMTAQLVQPQQFC